MRFSIPSLILVFLCACTIFSCTKKQKITVKTETSNTPGNYTLAAIEDQDLSLQFNAYRSAQPNKTIDEILEKYAPNKEVFKIAPSAISTITCENGTVIKFDPNVFVYADSKLPVTEELKISVTEYLSDADILFKGLTTTCNNALIETAGMIYIEATAGGKNCEIKNGEFYNIEIPSLSEKKNMELFYGEETDKGINWVAASKGKFMGADGDKAYDLIHYVWSKKGPTLFEGGLGAMYNYLHDLYVLPDGFENVELKATSYIYFTVNYQGKLSEVYTPDENRTYADSQLIAAFENSPNWNVSLQEGDYRKKMMVPVKMNWVRDPSLIPAKLIAENKTEADLYSAYFQSDKYLMVSAKLGWINCDRFTDPQQPKKDLFVLLDSTYDATVRIVFKDIRSVMGGIRYTKGFNFNDIPTGESITVIAIRINNGVTEMAMKECSTDMHTINDLEFKPTNKEEMMQKFEQLGKDESIALK